MDRENERRELKIAWTLLGPAWTIANWPGSLPNAAVSDYAFTLKSLPVFFHLEVKYLIFVYLEVKCRTFLFLFKVCYFEVKYPHAQE